MFSEGNTLYSLVGIQYLWREFTLVLWREHSYSIGKTVSLEGIQLLCREDGFSGGNTVSLDGIHFSSLKGTQFLWREYTFMEGIYFY